MVASTVSVSRWVDVVSNKKMARQQNNLVVVEMDHGSLLRPSCLLTSPRLLILHQNSENCVNSQPLCIWAIQNPMAQVNAMFSNYTVIGQYTRLMYLIQVIA